MMKNTLKARTGFLFAAGFLACAAYTNHAQAATIDLALSRTEGVRTSSSAGTIAITTLNVGNPGPASQSILYTVTGLTLDSFGTGDDQFTFEMGLTGTSSTGAVTGLGASFGFWGVQDGTNSASLVDSDEALTFSFVDATVTLGAGGTETADIVFDGFGGFGALNVNANETFNVSGTASNNATNIDADPLPNSVAGESNIHVYDFSGLENSFTVEGNSGEMRYGYAQAQVTINVVPEPGSLALLGLGALVVARRRR